MATPFPGMDPYLERPNLWHGLHNRLIAGIADILGPLLRPRYFVAVEERSYQTEPLPPLAEEDTSWLDALLRQAKLR